jgi:hypothetical protein
MHRKFERDPARLANAFAHALGQFQMMPVAGREVGAGLRDADDRLARLQFLARHPVVQVALEIDAGHVRVVGIVEPVLAAEPLALVVARHVPASPCRGAWRSKRGGLGEGAPAGTASATPAPTQRLRRS